MGFPTRVRVRVTHFTHTQFEDPIHIDDLETKLNATSKPKFSMLKDPSNISHDPISITVSIWSFLDVPVLQVEDSIPFGYLEKATKIFYAQSYMKYRSWPNTREDHLESK